MIKACLLKLLLFTVLVLSTFKAVSQGINNITPMHLFLQKNSDSTIIFKKESNWISPPQYFIISKKSDTISLYEYKDIYDRNIVLRKKIRDTIFKLSHNANLFKVDINIFFRAKYIDSQSAQSFWKLLLMQKPWQIKDDKDDGGEGCPKYYTKEKYISDLGGISLHLITKNEIKPLYFYAPKYLETEVCPSRLGRKAILKIEELFDKYFRE